MLAMESSAGNSMSFSFDVVPFSTYNLVITKKNHVQRVYTVKVNDSDVTENALKICPIGDANLNGSVTSADSNAVYKHVLGTKKIADPYGIQCGDVVGSKPGLTSADSNSIYKHVLGSKKLY